MPKILSAFFDEAGQERQCEPGAKWYLLTLVLHDQSDDLSAHIAAYEDYIRRKGLPNVPFHMVELSQRMERDLKAFIENHLEEFQSFDMVAVYYDGGQSAVTQAVHGAFDEELSANVADYKKLRFQERRLSQVADYLCSIELANLRFLDGEVSPTYEKVYGTRRQFRANYLKQARRKLIV